MSSILPPIIDMAKLKSNDSEHLEQVFQMFSQVDLPMSSIMESLLP